MSYNEERCRCFRDSGRERSVLKDYPANRKLLEQVEALVKSLSQAIFIKNELDIWGRHLCVVHCDV